MTTTPTNILAAADSDFVIKIGVFLVIGVIWVISQIVGALSKPPDKRLPPARQTSSRQVPSRPAPPVAGPQSSTPSRYAPPPLWRRQGSAVPSAMQRGPAAIPPRRAPPQRPAATPTFAPPTPASPRARSTPTIAQEATSKPGDTLPRRQMLDALLKPRNLKKAFVVTELLGPPVALRPTVSSNAE